MSLSLFSCDSNVELTDELKDEIEHKFYEAYIANNHYYHKVTEEDIEIVNYYGTYGGVVVVDFNYLEVDPGTIASGVAVTVRGVSFYYWQNGAIIYFYEDGQIYSLFDVEDKRIFSKYNLKKVRKIHKELFPDDYEFINGYYDLVIVINGNKLTYDDLVFIS